VNFSTAPVNATRCPTGLSSPNSFRAAARFRTTTFSDPARSVVDRNGRVHGLRGLYVADGSVLPRSSRVNPSLTIYAWGLRLADRMLAANNLSVAA